MFINKNSNILKALSIFEINKIQKEKKDKNNSNCNDFKLDCIIDDITESQYVTRNFQIGLTYIQIAKSTLTEIKDTLNEMRDIFIKSKNESPTSFARESLNIKFMELRERFNNKSNLLNVDIKENLFYNSNNELVFKIFDSSTLDESILIPRLDPNKLNLKKIDIKNLVNAEIADERMNQVLNYILSSEKSIKFSENKLSKVNLTDIMSQNLLALSSNENKDSIKKLISYTKKGLIKDGYSYYDNINNKKNNNNLDDLLK